MIAGWARVEKVWLNGLLKKPAEFPANHKPVPLTDDAASALRSIVEEVAAENEEMSKKN